MERLVRTRTRTLTSGPAPFAASAAPATHRRGWGASAIAPLLSLDMHLGRIEVDIGPFQLANLRGPEAVPEGDQDHGRIPMTIAVTFGGPDQLLDFGRRQIFTGAQRGVSRANWN